MDLHLQSDWQRALGQDVEIWAWGKHVRNGRVDAVMADNSVLWVSGDGLLTRQMFARVDGYEVYAHFPPSRRTKPAHRASKMTSA